MTHNQLQIEKSVTCYPLKLTETWQRRKVKTGKFKDASITYIDVEQVNLDDLARWIEKSKAIQWDYKNIVKRKGVLVRLE
ncbi:hypothetical protein [Pedobacter nyackensis]|uniref:Uncharacterized protein n=1 Tax=Pedobacter nyackensis TaxID=475255 RepID=A0A1W2AMG4_9SPHI|nr:hypothetical protein [Pedobacter nyackensis]SMC61794.1 hypothetical protein SAMN04488101_101748 [Pedobacter nyackensis]